MSSNFAFLKETFPVLANFGELAEKYLYSDSNSCLMKLGMIGETIVNLIFVYDNLTLPRDNTAAARIDEQLRKVGWEADTENLRYSGGTRPAKGRNIAIAEWPTDSAVGNRGYVDYTLFIGEQMVATIEAKAIHKDIPSVIDYQCKEYSRNIRSADAEYQIGTWGNYGVPFTFATNGRPYLEQYDTKSGVWFLDFRQLDNAPKALMGWMSPAGMLELLQRDIAARNQALRAMPYDLLRDKDGLNLREYQLKAIQAAENAITSGQQNILLAMATGTGKTRTILGMIYRFLKTGRFRRILFLKKAAAFFAKELD